MKDEALVQEILQAVVEAVDVPVTLKMRTGWAPEHKNAPVIAEMAQQAGIQSLAVHGRTRSCGYKGEVEYHTIRDIKQHIDIPVFANGDITSPEKAAYVMDFTGADGILIGRAAQGRPWIFREITHFLETGQTLPTPKWSEVEAILLEHLNALYEFYGDYLGVRIARKHVSWYLQAHKEGLAFRKIFNRLESIEDQLQALKTFFKDQKDNKDLAA